MKHASTIALTVVIVSCTVAFQCRGQEAKEKDKDARRHVEKAGGFSFVPPEEWKVVDFPGLKYKIVLGPVNDAFASNINVIDQVYKGSQDEYVKANLAFYKMQAKKFRLVDQSEFKTIAGLHGTKLIFEQEQNNKLLRQTQYFFENTDTKYVITGSTVTQGGEKLDAVFEKCVKTFRFEKP